MILRIGFEKKKMKVLDVTQVYLDRCGWRPTCRTGVWTMMQISLFAEDRKWVEPVLTRDMQFKECNEIVTYL